MTHKEFHEAIGQLVGHEYFTTLVDVTTNPDGRTVVSFRAYMADDDDGYWSPVRGSAEEVVDDISRQITGEMVSRPGAIDRLGELPTSENKP